MSYATQLQSLPMLLGLFFCFFVPSRLLLFRTDRKIRSKPLTYRKRIYDYTRPLICRISFVFCPSHPSMPSMG
ncbi:hypothetical protein F5Y17DRAFT_437388 [Xylariaceae sp. FL0594]|nr:hypothetical protein F5Y17DRAFT_437388 [Xylariaceae sp. FL0594]